MFIQRSENVRRENGRNRISDAMQREVSGNLLLPPGRGQRGRERESGWNVLKGQIRKEDQRLHPPGISGERDP